MFTRLDILTPNEVLQPLKARFEDEGPTLMGSRDVLAISLQSDIDGRREHRAAFRSMAKDMASRYLRRMPVFERKGLRRLEDFLSTEEPLLPEGKLLELRKSVDSTQKRLTITAQRRAKLEEEIDRYALSTSVTRVTTDIRLAMLSILMHRHANRIPQESLFREERDPNPSRPVLAKKAVFEGARIHLLHRYGRPFYYGMTALADASSENAEQFLHLAYSLVDMAETQLTRRKGATLDAPTQNKVLQSRAHELLQNWSFPYHKAVRHLTSELGKRCVEVSVRPNAVLGAGGNAYGIRSAEFDMVAINFPDIARVLQFAIAYNAITLVREYPCKNESWCLLELGGLVCVRAGLTLQRGGFLEGSVAELARMMSAAEAA
jgi:hypothetical protein